MIGKEEANEKVKDGSLRTWMMFEVLAVKEETTKKSLEGLIDRLDEDSRVKLYKKEFGDVKEVEKPLKNIEKGYSLTCEVELVASRLDNLVQIVTEYGPSAIEIIEPKKFDVDAGEAQTILNTISHIMHQFAAAGAGGMVMVRGK
ncbi:MAG: hypothetical protein JW700_04300 [Candidatus Aenigmarchaeota archaeon]|nr:hypothetical protein [Candidatus Aenigmarchaeota archaeon]